MWFIYQCLLLLCFGSSGSFTAPEEVVQVGVFNLWPPGLQGCERRRERGSARPYISIQS